MAGKAQRPGHPCLQWQETVAPLVINEEAERKTRAGFYSSLANASKACLSKGLPPARSHLLKALQPPKTESTSGDQVVFAHMSPWEDILNSNWNTFLNSWRIQPLHSIYQLCTLVHSFMCLHLLYVFFQLIWTLKFRDLSCSYNTEKSPK